MSASIALPRPGSVGAWRLAARLRTLPAAIVPVAVGTAITTRHGAVRWDAALAALVGAVLLQIGTNFANDVFDAEKGADRADRVGEARAVASGLLSPGAMRAGMVVAFAAATLAGAYLALVAGWPIVVIGVLSIASGIAYTGGPFPLGYHGLGDVFVLVFFGPVAVAGTTFAETGTVPRAAWIAGLGLGALATNVLVVNNVRDRDGDARAGKRTLAVRFGRRVAEHEAALLYAVAYATVVATAALDVGLTGLLPLATVPAAVGAYRELRRGEGRALDATLGRTARVLLGFGALWALGIAWPSA